MFSCIYICLSSVNQSNSVNGNNFTDEVKKLDSSGYIISNGAIMKNLKMSLFL